VEPASIADELRDRGVPSETLIPSRQAPSRPPLNHPQPGLVGGDGLEPPTLSV
jgi:hypothetical protein